MLAPLVQNRDRQGAAATYLITWVCYGAWLPGQRGAVPRIRNQPGAPLPEPDTNTKRYSRNRMLQDPYLLDAVRRQVVLNSAQQVCFCRGWTLWAAHIRTNHIHVVITANCRSERVMNALKSYSSRALNDQAVDGQSRRRWARHGSTRYPWTEDAVRAAIQYVVREQGEPMALFEKPSPR
jgi:REP element-mobilizing transposase RayT